MSVPPARIVGADVQAPLEAAFPGTYIGDGEGPTDPVNTVPAVVVHIDPGWLHANAYAPNSDLSQTLALVGSGRTARQASDAAVLAHDWLIAHGLTKAGRRVIVTADDAPPPRPIRDDSLSRPLFSQTVLLNIRN